MNRKAFTVGVIILLLIGVNVSGDIDTKESTSSFDGNILYVGGSGPGNYTTIQSAIDDALDGYTVFVYSGVYYENVFIDKSIHIIGEDKYHTIIDGMKNDDVIHIDNHFGEVVSICGFTIRDCATYPGLFAGVFLDKCDSNKIFNNIFLNNEFDGIKVYDSHYNNIFNNFFINNDLGIYIYKGENNSIYNNLFSENYVSIELFRSENNSIFNNVIELNGRSIDLYYSGYNKIFLNLINNNTEGITLSYSSNYVGYTSYNMVFKNSISNNSYNGLRTNNASNNFLYHNNFIENHNGHVIDGSNNTWDDGYPSGGNYWDDYNGIDSDGDGIGDIPYSIPGGDNEDRYPYMNPIDWPNSNLDCSGELDYVDCQPGETYTGQIFVENIGGPNSFLNWEIVEFPDWADWTFSPINGTDLRPEDGLFTIDVEFTLDEDLEHSVGGIIRFVNLDNLSDTCTIGVMVHSKPVVKNTPIQLVFLLINKIRYYEGIESEEDVLEIIESDAELSGIVEKLKSFDCGCEDDTSDDDRLWPFPIICTFFGIIYVFYIIHLARVGIPAYLVEIVLSAVYEIFDCNWP